MAPIAQVLVALATVMAALLAIATLALGATIDGIGFSPDPTEDEPVSVTVSGGAEAGQKLYVFHHPNGAACGPSQIDGSGELTSAFTDGDALNPGAFSKTYSFTPTAPGSHRICAYIAEGRFSDPLSTQSATVTVRVPATAINPITFSADPTEDEPVTLTVSGSTESPRKLYVFHHANGAACGPSQIDGSGELTSAFNDGDALNAGPFTKTYSFTPTAPGSHRICAYIAEGRFSEPLSTQSATVTVRAPGTAIGPLIVSADPTEDEPVTLTVSGSTESPRKLYVFHHANGAACGPTQIDGSGELTSAFNDGDALNAGPFTKTYSFTPTAPGSHRICAYVAKGRFDAPLATGEATIAVRAPSASATVSAGVGPYLAGESATVTATGDAEHAARFTWTFTRGEVACSADQVMFGTEGTSVGPGPFSIPVQIEYGPEAAHTLCLFVMGKGWTALAESRHVIHKLALEAPALEGEVLGRARKPTFIWRTAPAAEDIFVLLGGDEPILFASEKGAARTVRGKPDPRLGRIVRRDDGTAAVTLRRPLPPGRYAWQVERFRDEGEEVASEPRAFRLTGPRLARLTVKATAQRGTTSRRPGRTVLTIRATPYARVTVTLRRGGRVRTLPFPAWSTSGVGRVRVDWSCSATGSPFYRYTVLARDEQGNVKRRSGRFAVVSRAACRSMKAAEDAARARRIAAEQARLRAEAARQAAEERAQYLRFVRNCRALGGTPVAIERSFGTTTMCRAPYGGYLSVPS